MKKYTEKKDDGSIVIAKGVTEERFLERMFAYEETGLDPEEVTSLIEASKKKTAESITRETVLEAARKCVCGDREQDYGSPENNFRTIANLWIDYLNAKGGGVDIEPEDVAAMLVLLKIARIASGHAKNDNWIDAAGYAACGGELQALGA